MLLKSVATKAILATEPIPVLGYSKKWARSCRNTVRLVKSDKPLFEVRNIHTKRA